MWWVLLIAVSPDTFVTDGVYSTREECELKREIEFDKCWPATLELLKVEGEQFFVLKSKG